MSLAIIDFDVEPFRNALNALFTIIDTKPQRDILKCFKFDAEPDRVLITATDMEIFARIELTTVTVNNSGSFVLPAQILVDFVRTIEEEQVTLIATENDSVRFEVASTQFEAGTQDLDEYPTFPKIPEDDKWISVDVDSLNKALTKVLFAVADQGHPKWGALSAVSVELNKNYMLLVGTDQHRASLAKVSLQNTVVKNLLVNPEGLAVVPKIFSGNLEMYVGESNLLLFRAGGNILTMRLIHGNFPAVASLIPKHKNGFSLSPSMLLKQVKKAALATDSDQNKRVRLEIKNGKICLSARSRQGRKRATVDFDINYAGPEVHFSVNSEYLLELLKVAGREDNLEIQLGQNTQAIVFKQEDFCHLLVPQEPERS